VSYGTIFHKTIRILNAETESIFVKLIGHTDRVSKFAKLPNERLASCSYDMTVKIWHWRNGLSERNITGHSNAVIGLLLLNNKTLLSCSCDQTIKFWNVSNGELLKTLLAGYCIFKFNIIFLHNGPYLATHDDYKLIYLFSVTSGVIKAILDGHEERVLCLVSLDQTSNDSFLASGSVDKKIIIWNYLSREKIKTILCHTDVVYSLQMLTTGHLASGSKDGTVRIWNLEVALTLNMTFADSHEVLSLTVMSNGNLAISYLWGNIEIRHFSTNSNFSGEYNC
jgi:WD40 repeat protein